MTYLHFSEHFITFSFLGIFNILFSYFIGNLIDFINFGKLFIDLLNIDNLPTNKIRQLQRYVRDKTTYLEMNSNN